MQQSALTHEQFIARVVDIAVEHLESEELRCKAKAIKLTYGAGPRGVRGVTYYNAWSQNGSEMPFVEISAFNQESICQVAGTVLHEIGHVLAPIGAGHGPQWKAACEALGLRKIKAAGTNYGWAHFSPILRDRITALGVPVDGKPRSLAALNPGRTLKPRVCGAGIGTRGGKSRGQGSGSRLRLYECECAPKPFKVRIASDEFDATCNCCDSRFLKR